MKTLERENIRANAASMPVRAIVPYFGSKRTLADRIVAELGPHHTYFEPFCGSMAVLLAKKKCRMETVNDLNGDLVNLARVIQSPILGPKLYRMCRRMLMSEAVHNEMAAAWKAAGRQSAPEKPDIDAALRYFFSSWVGRNGVTGTYSYNQGFAARFTPNRGHGGTRWQSVVCSIPAWRRRIADLTILSRDGIELLEKIYDAPGVAIYCDPPYVEKGASYIHDFTSDDHARLATALSRFKRARVVVSYYEHPNVRELYAAWNFVSVPTTKAMVSQGRRSKGHSVKAPEILVVNGDSTHGLFGGEVA